MGGPENDGDEVGAIGDGEVVNASRNLFPTIIKIAKAGSLSTISAYLFLTSSVPAALKGR